MRSDRFMQGILVSDDDELFSYTDHKSSRNLNNMLKKIKKLKNNLTSFKYVTQHNQQNYNKQAVFSKTAVGGNVDKAISDVRDRLRNRPS